MAKNKKRAYEGEVVGSSLSPPLKRQKIGAASYLAAVTDCTTQQPRQRLHNSEYKNARLQERQQEEENGQRLHALSGLVREGICQYGPSWNGRTTDIDIIDNLGYTYHRCCNCNTICNLHVKLPGKTRHTCTCIIYIYLIVHM